MSVGERLSGLVLESPKGDAPDEWRVPYRRALCVVVVHEPTCAGCMAYLDELAGARETFGLWDGRVVAVVSGRRRAARELAERTSDAIQVRADPRGEVRRRLGLSGGEAAACVVDRWGQIYHLAKTEGTGAAEKARHGLPDANAVAQWFRYLATQCPECGVPDEPGYGPWRASD